MNKVYVITKVFTYSEEDHDSEVVLVCSSEDLAREFINLFCRFLTSDSKTSYFYEEFNVI